MIHELAPHISCVADPESFEEAKASSYVKIYVPSPTGIILHHKLQGENRFIQVKVETIPGYTLSTPVIQPLRQTIQFLPAGKIPYELFEQIIAFFKKVSEVKKSDLEAMAWVMWSAERGYFIQIPDQTISKAAVSYDWASVPAGCSLILDIHSHNTMGAFFSGTDNNDDRNAINYSGVAGRLDQEKYETVFRFNYLDKKYEAAMADIFAPRQSQVIPTEWIDAVKTGYTRTYSGNGSYNYGGNNTTGKGTADRAWPPHQSSRNQVNNAIPPSTAPALHGKTGSTSETPGLRLGPQFPMSQRPESNIKTGNNGNVIVGVHEAWAARQQELLEESKDPRFNDFFDEKGRLIDPPDRPFNSGGIPGLESEDDFTFGTPNFFGGSGSRADHDDQWSLARAEEMIDRMRGGEGTSLMDLAEQGGMGNVRDGNEMSLSSSAEAMFLLDAVKNGEDFSHDPRWNDLICNMGMEKAMLFMVIDTASPIFEGEDTTLYQILTEYYAQLTPEGQSNFFRGLFQSLPKEERERIEMNGL